MVEQVTAFKDSSGAVHLDETSAARAEAKLQLEKILGGKAEVCVTAILSNVEDIHTAITPLVELLMQQMFDKPVGETGQSFEERYPSNEPAGHGRAGRI